MNLTSSLETYDLDTAASERLRSAMTDFDLPADGAVDAAIHDAKARWRAAAPPSLNAALEGLRHGDGSPALLIRGLPFDPAITRGLDDTDVPLAPKADRLSEGLLLGAAAQVGQPFGVASEGHGLVNNLCPVRRSRDGLTGLGSRQPLDLHIENAVLRRSQGEPCTDGLALIGLSADPCGGPTTRVADARLALRRMSGRDADILRQPRFLIDLPMRWRRPGRDDRRPAAIVSGSGRDLTFAFAFYGDMVTAVDAEAALALRRFRAALEAVVTAVVLEPGKMLLINNRIAGHGRGGFEPSYTEDGSPRRWVQRVFWIDDLARLTGWRETARVFERPPA